MARAAQTDRMPMRQYPSPLTTLWGVSRATADARLPNSAATSMAAMALSVERMAGSIYETRQLEASTAQLRAYRQGMAALHQWVTNPIGPMPPEARAIVPGNFSGGIPMAPRPPQPAPHPAPAPARPARRARKLFGRLGKDDRSR